MLCGPAEWNEGHRNRERAIASRGPRRSSSGYSLDPHQMSRERPDAGSRPADPLLRVAGLDADLSHLPGTRVDVVVADLLRLPVSDTALVDAVAV